jgi:sugar fermentation stimulation protein A
MMVEIEGELEKCHCPSTGRIGKMDFHNIPCLLSKSNSKVRKTNYTVEAFYPEPNNDLVIGINQTKANSYVDFFLKNNLLPKMLEVDSVRREVFLNKSKIDFFLNDNCYLEVKTLLSNIPFGNKKITTKYNSFERLVRHYTEISSQISKGQKAIVLLCNLYDAKPYNPPLGSSENGDYVKKAVKKAIDKGLEHWQINLQIDQNGVSLIDYFKVDLLPYLN